MPAYVYIAASLTLAGLAIPCLLRSIRPMHSFTVMPEWHASAYLAAAAAYLSAALAVALYGLGYTRAWAWPGGMLLIALIGLFWRPNPRPASPAWPATSPNFEKWDRHGKFSLYEAACLWFDREPELPMCREARGLFREWQSAVERGRMFTPCAYDFRTDEISLAAANGAGAGQAARHAPLVNIQTIVSRAVLRDWAQQRGEQPRFLFPEQRADRRERASRDQRQPFSA